MAVIITKDRVLATGKGQCLACRTRVVTVLVVNHVKNCREWFAVHPEGENFRVHECPSTPGKLAEAA